MALGLLLIVGRLWQLQVAQWSSYSERALDMRTKVVWQEAPRGFIYDRHGEHVLAENHRTYSLHVIPAQLPEGEQELEKRVQFIASTLSAAGESASTAEVREALMQAKSSKSAEPVPLGELGADLTFDQVAMFDEHRLEFPAITVVTQARRFYPHGELAAHAIGYARAISKEKLEEYGDYQYPEDPEDPTGDKVPESASDPVYRHDSTIGYNGVEAMCEMDLAHGEPKPILPGRWGRSIYEVDAGGNPQRLVAKREPQKGADVYVTLDAKAQYAAERALKTAIAGGDERMGAAVVMDAHNGELIALASEPCLNLNDWVTGRTSEQWEQISNAPGLPLFNKAIAGAYPPGSIFKVISVCAGLETTDIQRSTTYVCEGRITVGSRHKVYKCWLADRGGHGYVDLIEAIAKSCNVWFYHSVLDGGLSAEAISKYARRFGLGELTGLGLKGETGGRVPAPEYRHRPWRTGDTLNYVIGQGDLTVTPLQMAVVCAALANGGKLVPPRIVDRIDLPDYLGGKTQVREGDEPKEIKFEDERSIRTARVGMRHAVTSEHGTAHSLAGLARLRASDFKQEPKTLGGKRTRLPLRVAAKTGTAQHRMEEPNHAWCIAFAPYMPRQGERQYAICVFVARGGTGASSAVPVVKEILRALFGLHDNDDPAFALPEVSKPERKAHEDSGRG